jgi:hypothetical protein
LEVPEDGLCGRGLGGRLRGLRLRLQEKDQINAQKKKKRKHDEQK